MQNPILAPADTLPLAAQVPAGGYKRITAGGEQAEYIALPATIAVSPQGVPLFITRWTLDDAQRAALAAGGDVVVTLCYSPDKTGGVVPMLVSVGPVAWNEM